MSGRTGKMERDEAESLVRRHVSGEFLLKHMFATEAIMSAAARFLNEDEEIWGLCGLLHDIDFEKTKDNPTRHGVVAQDILKSCGLPDILLQAILAHNYLNAPERHEKIEHALVAADSMTGLVIACAMVKGKRLENVTEETVKNAFKKKGFAAGSKRDMIMECEKAGIPFGTFIEISLGAMKGIAGTLGL